MKLIIFFTLLFISSSIFAITTSRGGSSYRGSSRSYSSSRSIGTETTSIMPIIAISTAMMMANSAHADQSLKANYQIPIAKYYCICYQNFGLGCDIGTFHKNIVPYEKWCQQELQRADICLIGIAADRQSTTVYMTDCKDLKGE